VGPAAGGSLGPGANAPAFRLGLSLPEVVAIQPDALQAAAEEAAAEAPEPRKFWIGAMSVLAVGGAAANSFTDGSSQSFHVTHEGWFGRDTYAGGGDKVSHFVSYNVVTRLLTQVYGELGMGAKESRLLGAGVAFLAGLTNEFGDGTNKYGFSYEDLLADTLGAGAALATAHYGLDDVIGFRAGWVPAPEVPDPLDDVGKDYSHEIYTGDLKIAGLSRRLCLRPGPARFLLLSVTYGVKGYPQAAPEVRERQIGIEIGLHLTEILRAVGVPQNRWWQRVLFVVLDSIRFPYTAVGFQFDVNHKQWRGPGIGDDFPGGKPKL
jgi:hypothetical protein